MDKKVSYEREMTLNNEKRQMRLENAKVIWLFGLSGSGKSTISGRLNEVLVSEGINVYRLDGDCLRLGLNSDLGFSDEGRMENIRRAAEVAKLFADAGFLVLVSMITPMQSMRALAREIIGANRFVEVYVKASLEACEARDPKGLYKKARNGEIKDFTGIGSPFEEGADSDLLIDTEKLGLEEAAEEIIKCIGL